MVPKLISRPGVKGRKEGNTMKKLHSYDSTIRRYNLRNLIVDINRDYHNIVIWKDGDFSTLNIQTLALEGRGRLNYKDGKVFHQTIAELVKLYD